MKKSLLRFNNWILFFLKNDNENGIRYFLKVKAIWLECLMNDKMTNKLIIQAFCYGMKLNRLTGSLF